MSAPRRRASADTQNLDSLLDTMANVTGILIVLLAVTQLSVGDAMARIRGQLAERPELTREELVIAEAEAVELVVALEPLAARREELEQTRRQGREELAALRTRNTATRSELEAARRFPADAEALEQAVAANRRAAGQLEGKVVAARREIAVLDRELAGADGVVKPRVSYLPDPHPPPRRALQVPVFVRYGRVVRVDGSLLIGSLKQGTREGTDGKWEFRLGLPNFVDRTRLAAYFQVNDIGTEQFRWHIINNGGLDFWAQLEWRDKATGETLEELLGGRSQFERDLQVMDPRNGYLAFFVWDDSFEAYLAARDLATDKGFSAGWEPRGQHVPLRQPLAQRGGSVRID